MNHYETLGVSRDATSDEIKRAYRKRAMKAHPDQVGENGHDRMAELNRAYATLSDPELRAYYDTSGQDMPVDVMTPETRARRMVFEIVSSVADDPGNIVLLATRKLTEVREQAAKIVAAGDEIIERVKHRIEIVEKRPKRGKKKVDADDNLVRIALEGTLPRIQAKRDEIAERVNDCDRALALLAEYKSEEADVEPEEEDSLLAMLMSATGHRPNGKGAKGGKAKRQ